MSAEQNPMDEQSRAKAMKGKTLSTQKRAAQRESSITLPQEHVLPILQVDQSSEATGPPNTATSTPIDFDTFWSKFRFFPWGCDEFTSSYGYLFSFINYFLILVIDLIRDLLNHHGSFSLVIARFNETHLYIEFKKYWLFWISVVMISIIVKVFNHWRMSLRGTFEDILNKGRISSLHEPGDLQGEYKTFLEEYEEDLLSKRRHLILGGILGPILIIIMWTITKTAITTKLQNPDSLLEFLWNIMGVPIPAIISIYGLVIFSWLIYATGKRLRHLPLNFKLNIQPSHPDACGGLSVLGDVTFGMVLPMLLLILLLGLATGTLFTPTGKQIMESKLSAFFLPCLLVLLYIAFFVPLWSIHSKMVERRKAYEDEFAKWSTQLEQKIHASIVALEKSYNDQALDTARNAKEELEVLQTIHPNKLNYPTWPFNSRIGIAFFTLQLGTIPTLLVAAFAKELFGFS